jgi:hypothetical protein
LFLASFSDTERAEIASQPDGLEQISKAFGEVFKKLGPHRASYVYDSEGRLVQMRHDGMTMRVLVNKTYNDHGDIIEERQSYTENSEIPVGVDFSLDQNGNFAPDKPPSEWASQPQLPPPMVMHYSYIYDSYGNWTDRTSTFPGGTNHHTQHRTLTYF